MSEMRAPTLFIWVCEGQPCVGTLADWVKQWEHDYYSGDQSLSAKLLTWDGKGVPMVHFVRADTGVVDEEDKIPCRFTVSGAPDKALIFIDGRA